ncbi:MAG: glutaredoxin domain-containing protein [Candidatus Micrarchaeota archaeon]
MKSIQNDSSKAVLYCIPTHPAAVEAREFFKKSGVAFEERDVTKSALWAEELMRKTGQNSLPLVEYRDKNRLGFDASAKEFWKAELKTKA